MLLDFIIHEDLRMFFGLGIILVNSLDSDLVT